MGSYNQNLTLCNQNIPFIFNWFNIFPMVQSTCLVDIFTQICFYYENNKFTKGWSFSIGGGPKKGIRMRLRFCDPPPPVNVPQDFATPTAQCSMWFYDPPAYYGLTLMIDWSCTLIVVNTAITTIKITHWTRMVVLS